MPAREPNAVHDNRSGADFPLRIGRFFGRTDDLAALTAHLESGARLVSIVGPPGVGKTRLAMELLEKIRLSFSGGTCLCSLASVREGEELPDAVARMMQAPSSPQATAAERAGALGWALAARGRMLLVLDNLEQIIDASASSIQTWLKLAPEVSILATSRETLRIPGEVVHELLPLPEGVELFLERARRICPEYASKPEDEDMIAPLVARLDGLPLAIELAASYARLLSPQKMLARLERRGDLLGMMSREATDRHATMRKAIAWSWDLLDEHERGALCVASVFQGGFSLESAESVLGEVRAAGAPDALTLLQSLVDKSLLRREQRGARLGMVESISEFAAEKLVLREESEAASFSHAKHYLGVFDSLRDAGCLPDDLRERLSVERTNYRAILTHFARGEASLERCTLALRAGIVLSAISPDDCLSVIEVGYLDQAIERAPAEMPPALLAEALLVCVRCCRMYGWSERTERDARRAVALAETSGDEFTMAVAQRHWGEFLYDVGRLDAALDVSQSALFHARAAGHVVEEVRCLLVEGHALHCLNRSTEALDRFRRALARSKWVGYRRGLMRSNCAFAIHDLMLGRFEPARISFERSIGVARELRYDKLAAIISAYLGLLHFDHDKLPEALSYLSTAISMVRVLGDRANVGSFMFIEAALMAAQDDIEGAAVAIDAAIPLLESNPFYLEVNQVREGHLDVARCRAALAAGDLATWALCRAAARSRLEKAEASGPTGSLLDRSDDARLAHRILKRHFDRLPQPGQTVVKPSENELHVAHDGSWFEVGSGPRVHLEGRTAQRLILTLLVDRAISMPAEVLRSREMIELVWPGERLSKGDGRNRLHVALNMLRKLGLRDVIERAAQGYRISGRVRVSRG